MLNLPDRANRLFDAVPFPEHDGGLYGCGRAIRRPWDVRHCRGELSIRPDGTPTPQATVTFGGTKLRTVLAAAARAWPETVPSLPDDTTGLTSRPASQWLPELLPLAEHDAREHLTLDQRPVLRLRFEPAPDTTLSVTIGQDDTDTASTVIGALHSRDYEAVTRFMLGLHNNL